MYICNSLFLLFIFIYAGLPITYAGDQVPNLHINGFDSLFQESTKQAAVITGRVISLTGLPIQGAEVSTSAGQATSNATGWFEIPASSASVQWVRVKHPNYLSRTRAAQAGEPVLFRLTSDDGQTVAIHFGGDTMFGRRYYDPNQDGNTEDGLLPNDAGTEEHLALLKWVRPLLENAHITVLNLETPLAENPYYDHINQPRPKTFHPDKSITFATHVNAAQALKQAGVDLVDLGNNHIYDMLETGVINTTVALKNAGLLQVGAGMTFATAWQPAVITIAGQTFAFIGCSATRDYEISLFASDNKGGAAYCQENNIRQAVAKAKAQYDNVIMMTHSGRKYRSHPNDKIKHFTAIAREAGATLVINHGPHVVGGFDWNGQSLVAWALGNFAFDQNYWMTFQSYLLTVHLRKGKVIRAYTEPLMIESYLPKAVSGRFADYIAREAAGREIGPFVVENGAMETDLNHKATRQTTTVSLDGGVFPGKIFALPRSQWVSGITGSARLGRDLLWTGTLERNTVDETSEGGALWRLAKDEMSASEEKRNLALWRLKGEKMLIGPEYAHTGERGIQLRRKAEDKNHIILTLVDRVQMPPSTKEISVTGWLRTSENAKVVLSVYWYDTRYKASINHKIEALVVPSANTWTPFEVHLTVPAQAIAVKPFLRLAPPKTGNVSHVSADFDDLRLIAWAPRDTTYSPLYDHIWIVDPVDLQISQDILPGASAWAVKSLFFLVPTLQRQCN